MRRTAMVRVELIKPRTHVRGSQSVGDMAMADLFCRPGFPAHLNFSCSDVTRREHPCATVILSLDSPIRPRIPKRGLGSGAHQS